MLEGKRMSELDGMTQDEINLLTREEYQALAGDEITEDFEPIKDTREFHIRGILRFEEWTVQRDDFHEKAMQEFEGMMWDLRQAFHEWIRNA